MPPLNCQNLAKDSKEILKIEQISIELDLNVISFLSIYQEINSNKFLKKIRKNI